MSRSHHAPDVATRNDPLLGALVGDRYKIDRLIGRGGVGVVYLAKDTQTDGDVVIKILAPNWIGNAEILARFDREVERLSGLQHPNIVDLYDFGHHDGRAFMVMEYIEGELLKSYIARKKRLSLEEFVPIAGQILKGIGYAHSRGLMHRDLNPANIMLCIREGKANFVKILDFGLAKLKEGEVKVTEQHDLVGTAGFLAPEQIKGEDIDLRVDVYSIGVMFYNMLSGRMPFEGEHNATLLYKHVHEPPLPLADILPVQHTIPVHLIRLIHDCLEKSPDQRPEDANEMVEDLIDCVPAALFRLPDESQSDLVLPSASATMVGLGIPGESEPPGHWPAVAPGLAAGLGGFGGGGPPKPILVHEPEDDEEDELADETVSGPGVIGPQATGTAGNPNAADSSMPTLRESTQSLLDAGIEASTSALPSKAYIPQSASTSAPAASTAPPPAKGKTGVLLFGAVIALLIGAGFAYTYLNQEPEKPAAKTMSEDEVRAALDRAEEAVEGEDFRAATRELDATKAYLLDYPAEQARADRISEKVVIGQLLATARKLEGEGNSSAAIAAYRDVVERDPTNAAAREALARVAPDETLEEPGGAVGSVVITSNPTADLYIDDTSYGTTPYSGQLPVGTHSLRMEARGYEIWQSTVEIKGDKNDPFRVSMKPRSRGSGGKTRPKPTSDGTASGGGETPPETPPDSGGSEPETKDGDSGGMFLPDKKDKGGGIFLPVGGK